MFIHPGSERVKQFILPIVLLLFTGLVVIFYTRQNRKIPVPEKPGIRTGLFWMITGNGLKDTSYMYGTMHFVCRDSVRLSPLITNAVLHSRVFFTEVFHKDAVMNNLTAYLIKSDTTLRSLIGAGDYQRLKQLVDTIKYPEAVLNRLPPNLVHRLLVNKILSCDITSYDEELEKIASNAKLKLSALESLTEHVVPSDVLPLQPQAATLKRTLGNMEKATEKLRDDLDLYAHQKTYYHKDEIAGDRRNRKWVPIIEKAINRQPCFFAFGSAHLFGETGMIRALEAEGYTVTRIDY